MQEVSVAKRHFLFTLACSHVLLASGEAYGWTALRPVLIDSGFFDSFPLDQQSSMLTAVATMGIAANALCKLPLGIFLDSYGPRFTAVLGAIFLSTGSLLLALGDKQSQSVMMLGYFLLGVAGPFLQMPCFQFSELFGQRKASAMAYLITCFELSTGVFWVFGQLHNLFQLDRTSLFLCYSGVGVYTLVTALLFWPDLPYRSPPPPHRPQVDSALLLDPAPNAACTPPASQSRSRAPQHKDAPARMAPPRPAATSMINRPLGQQVLPLPARSFRGSNGRRRGPRPARRLAVPLPGGRSRSWLRRP